MPATSASKKTKAPVQAMLNFKSVKETASAGKKGVKEPTLVRRTSSKASLKVAPPAPAVVEKKTSQKRRRARDSDEDEDSEEEEDEEQEFIHVPSDDDEPEELAPQAAPAEEVKLVEPEEEVEEEEEDPATSTVVKGKEVTKGMKELTKDPQFVEAYKVAQEAIGGSMTASLKTERKAKTILRVFDLSYEYGPCVGLTRMERWNRASKRGLNPPEIVRLILETGKADDLKDDDLTALEQSVFHGMV